jgi:hypothetical protein
MVFSLRDEDWPNRSSLSNAQVVTCLQLVRRTMIALMHARSTQVLPREYSGEAEHETRKPNDASGRPDEQKGTGLSIDQGVISELFVKLFDVSQKKKLTTGLSR